MSRFLAALFAVCAVAFTSAASAASKIEPIVSPGGIKAWLVREPSVPMIAVDFAFAEGIATHHEEGPDLLGEESSRSRTYRIMLTKKGRDLLAVIREMKDCLVVEKEFLSDVGKKVTQQQVESLFTWSDGS